DSVGWGVLRVGASVFFFQAEDGIRDFHVTGVQTCALPISRLLPSKSTMASEGGKWLEAPGVTTRGSGSQNSVASGGSLMSFCCRSEERRVGKECRERGGREDLPADEGVAQHRRHAVCRHRE